MFFSSLSASYKAPSGAFSFGSYQHALGVKGADIYPTTYRAIHSRDVIDFFITSGMMRSLSLSRRPLSYYVRIFSPGAAFALWAFAVYDFYRGFEYISSLMVISSTIADLASGDG